MRVRLIGVGSAFGDDGAGPAVVARLLAGGLPADVVAVTCARPAFDLAEALDGADAAVLVDAMRSGRAPGSVARVAPGDLPRLGSVSSHGLGVAEGLALARALGRCPERVEVVGVEVDAARLVETGGLPDGEGKAEAVLSAPVLRGVARAAALVRDLLVELTREPAARG